MVVTCPHCQARLQAKDSAAGKQFKCPKCQNMLTVPAAAAPTAPAPTPQPMPSIQANPTPAAPANPFGALPQQPAQDPLGVGGITDFQAPAPQQAPQQFSQPAPSSLGGSSNYSSAPSGSLGGGWYPVRSGMSITMVCMVVSIVGMLFLMIASLAGMSGGGGGRGAARLLASMFALGIAFIAGSQTPLLAGWCLGTVIPENSRAKPLAIGSAASLGLCFLLTVILMLISPDIIRMGGRSAGSATQVITWLLVFVYLCSFGVYAQFMAGIGRYFRDKQPTVIAAVYAGYLALYLIWFSLLVFGAIRPTSRGMVMAVMIFTELGMMICFGGVLMVTFMARVRLHRSLKK